MKNDSNQSTIADKFVLLTLRVSSAPVNIGLDSDLEKKRLGISVPIFNKSIFSGGMWRNLEEIVIARNIPTVNVITELNRNPHRPKFGGLV